MSARSDAADRVVGLLAELAAARDPVREPGNASPWLHELKRWQSARLHRSFADLSATPRFAAASAFFLDDLYGEHDVSWRDRDVGRMLPTLRRWLPAPMLTTVADALELDLLSHRLDLRVAARLQATLAADARIDDAAYGRAYREAGTRAEREKQLALLLAVGEALDRIVEKPLIFLLLRMARGPASALGLGRLQSFLERGFAAFHGMGGARDFLAAIAEREHETLRRLHAGHPAPFDVAPSTAEQGARISRTHGRAGARSPARSRP